MKKNILWIIFPLCTLFSCTEKIDQSARYVFQDYTVTSYLETHEQYSTYYQLLDMVPVSVISKTTVKQLVSARGNYTVFAPTNEAIEEYLNKLHAKGIIETPSWDGFHDSITLDSVRQVIVYNSIIDGGDNTHAFETNNFPIANGAELPLSTMNDTKITVQYGDSTDWDIKVADAIVDKKNRDIPVSNGIIHAVHNVVAPDNNSLAQYLTNILGGRKEGFHVAALMVEAAGLMDTLSKVRDDVYEKLYQEGRIPDYTSQYGYTYDTNACAPEHRYYGFSFFAETDEFWSNAIGKPALEITLDDVMEYLEGQGVYPDATRDKNYTQENNLLNRFITYHIIPARLTPDRLIYHYNEMGYNHTTGNLGVAMSEFYVTLGKRRLLKIYESRESNGVYLNRFPNLDNRRHGTYHELSCDPDKEGVFVGETNREGENNIRNAIIYPINKLLVYDDDTRDNLGKYRIRFDMCALWTEMVNNDLRCSTIQDNKHQMVAIPNDNMYRYLNDAWMDDHTFFYYSVGYMNSGWHNYQGDETRVHGQLEMTVRLPPVPRSGTYELRYSVTSGSYYRSMVQFYWGDDFDNLAPMGIPMDLRIGGNERRTTAGTFPSGIGWAPDTDDDDYNAELDKKLRMNNFMKGANLYCAGNPGHSVMARNDEFSTRRILLRQFMDPDKVYYIRFKQVLDNPNLQFYMDYMEFCPKEVYDNPEEPEDIW